MVHVFVTALIVTLLAVNTYFCFFVFDGWGWWFVMPMYVLALYTAVHAWVKSFRLY